jgi:hypothetical protein
MKFVFLILALGLSIALAGLSGPVASQVASMRDDQTFRELNQEDIEWLAAQRQRTEKLIEGNADAQAKYQTSAGKLGVIRAVLDAKAFRADQTFELQGLGIILGDALAKELGMKWMMVEDQYGTSPCLVLEGTSIVLYPQTMISKRIERGETLDVFELFNWTAAKVAELRTKSD